MSEHHPSCKPSDKDLVWLCAQCGSRESAESLLIHAGQLAEVASEAYKILAGGSYHNAPVVEKLSAALAAWEKETK